MGKGDEQQAEIWRGDGKRRERPKREYILLS